MLRAAQQLAARQLTKHGRTESLRLPSASSLLGGAMPASTGPATSTWTNSRNPRSRWPKTQGRTLSCERPSRTSNPPTMAIKADFSLNCSAPVFCSLGPDTDKLTGEMASIRRGLQIQASGRVGEAAGAGLTSILAVGAGGAVGQAAQNFGFRNATRAANAVPADHRPLNRRATRHREAAGVGALEVLGGAVGAVVVPEVAIPAAIGLAAGAGGALVAGVGRSEASTQTAPASGSRVAAIAGGAFEGARAGAPNGPQLGQSWRGRCGRAWGRNVGPGPWRSGRRIRRREVHVGRQRGQWQFVRSSARHQNAQQHAARGPAATDQPETASRAAASSAADGV